MPADPEPPVITKVFPDEQGDILQITINRPEVHNAVDGAAARLLLAAWQRFRDDDRLLVAILHGAGDRAFCSGADLAALDTLANLGEGTDRSAQSIGRQAAGPLGGSRIIQTKPVITVAQGYAYAGGLELFCHGHIRLAEPAATFSVACRRFGVPLVDGGTVYLPRLLGWGSALPLIITGQRITAERAYQIGLVWELVESGHGVERAFQIARQLCRQPRDALLADLRSAIRTWDMSLVEALEYEGENLYPVMLSDSAREGMERFERGERTWFE